MSIENKQKTKNKKKGKIGANELRDVLASLGEELSDAQIDAMIAEIGDEKGFVTLEDFKKVMAED